MFQFGIHQHLISSVSPAQLASPSVALPAQLVYTDGLGEAEGIALEVRLHQKEEEKMK